jgi:DNA polymerase III sliding clamp (beta) subunit (PCNA family)
MLKELRFVQGAVAKKDFLPAMTHFAIENGTVRAYNGTLALCCPIPLDIACKPKAVPFVQAIAKCPDGSTPVLTLTATGRLSVRAGSFRALVECVADEETPHVLPEGERMDFDGAAMLKALKTLQPFIGDDASRAWCNGVLMRGQSMYATNNVILVEYWTGAQIPVTVNVPRVAVKEMLRINEAPTHAQVTPTSMTFHYSDGRWVRTQLLPAEWPDLTKLLDVPHSATTVDERIFEGLEAVTPFADKMGRVYIRDGKLSTVAEGNEEQAHGEFEIPGLDMQGIYQIEMLSLLKGVATSADFTTYPKPSLFFGDMLRGAIVGMRV